MIMCSITSMTRLESCPTIFGPGARGQFLASVFRRRSTVLLPFFLGSARTHRPRETVAVSQARCLGFSDFLPIPTLRTNRYDCSERSSLLRSRLIARRHLYGTGSDRMIMTDLPDHRWDSGLVLRMAQGLLGRIARHGVSTIWLRQRQGRRWWQRQRPVLGRGRQRARRPPAATEPRGRTLAAGRYPA